MTLVMGVLNVTPDSFYDGGRWADVATAIERGCAMAGAGADVIDVGGESTRPGASPVDENEEMRRVLPVIASWRSRLSGAPAFLSTRPSRRWPRPASEAGATILNDVSASCGPRRPRPGAGWVAMHTRGRPSDMMTITHYQDVVAEVKAFLVERAEQGGGGRRDRNLGRPRYRFCQDCGPKREAIWPISTSSWPPGGQ